MKKAIYIYIDGLDLAGKTTTVQLLKQKLPGRWVSRKNSLTKANPIAKLADKLKHNNENFDKKVLGYLYTAAVIMDFNQFKQPKVNTIQESWILLRAIAHNSADKNLDQLRIQKKLINKHPKFDRSFILTVSHQERMARFKKRLKENPYRITHGDKLIFKNPEALTQMDIVLANTAKKYLNATVIDCSNLTPEEVVSKIILELRLGKII